jgi:hypothetical protein
MPLAIHPRLPLWELLEMALQRISHLIVVSSESHLASLEACSSANGPIVLI